MGRFFGGSVWATPSLPLDRHRSVWMPPTIEHFYCIETALQPRICMIELRTRKNIVSCVFCRYKTLFVHVTIEIHFIRNTDKDTLYFDTEGRKKCDFTEFLLHIFCIFNRIFIEGFENRKVLDEWVI